MASMMESSAVTARKAVGSDWHAPIAQLPQVATYHFVDRVAPFATMQEVLQGAGLCRALLDSRRCPVDHRSRVVKLSAIDCRIPASDFWRDAWPNRT